VSDSLCSFVSCPHSASHKFCRLVSLDCLIFVRVCRCVLRAEAVDLLVNWVLAQKVPGLKLEVLREKGRTPLIFCEVTTPTTQMRGNDEQRSEGIKGRGAAEPRAR